MKKLRRILFAISLTALLGGGLESCSSTRGWCGMKANVAPGVDVYGGIDSSSGRHDNGKHKGRYKKYKKDKKHRHHDDD